MKDKAFYKADPVIKLCLKIAADLLLGWKHAVNNLEQIPLSSNEHSMYHD